MNKFHIYIYIYICIHLFTYKNILLFLVFYIFMSFHSFSINEVSKYILMIYRLWKYVWFDEKAPVTCALFKKPIFLLVFSSIITKDLKLSYLKLYTSVLHEQAKILMVRVHTIKIKYLEDLHLLITIIIVRYMMMILCVILFLFFITCEAVIAFIQTRHENTCMWVVDSENIHDLVGELPWRDLYLKCSFLRKKNQIWIYLTEI